MTKTKVPTKLLLSLPFLAYALELWLLGTCIVTPIVTFIAIKKLW